MHYTLQVTRVVDWGTVKKTKQHSSSKRDTSVRTGLLVVAWGFLLSLCGAEDSTPQEQQACDFVVAWTGNGGNRQEASSSNSDAAALVNCTLAISDGPPYYL